MKNLPHSFNLREDLIHFYQNSSGLSKGLFLIASFSLLFLTAYLLYSIYPVLSQMLDQVVSADYSTSIIQVGR